MPENKWLEFQNPEADYTIVDLGRPAVFLISAPKLKVKTKFGATVESWIETFLRINFGAFTRSSVPNFGVWHNGEEVIHDECVQYEVSFAGKEKIPFLLELLSQVAKQTGEKCIYLKAGQYSCLVYPK